MGWKVILLAAVGLFATVGCVTKKKTVDTSKSESQQVGKSEIVTTETGNVQVTSEFSGFELKDFAETLSLLNWQYAGTGMDQFSVEIKQTENGYKVEATGTGTAQGTSVDSRASATWQSEWNYKLDSISKSYESKIENFETRISEYEKNKSVEKETTGLQAGAYIVGAIALIVLMLLFWLGRKVSVILKEVRAVLNRL